jgi:hypothetical protein
MPFSRVVKRREGLASSTIPALQIDPLLFILPWFCEISIWCKFKVELEIRAGLV